MSVPNIPALRRGQVYQSLDKVELKSVRTGEVVATVGQVNAGVVRRDLRKPTREILRAVPIRKLLAMSREAGDLFLNGTLPLGDGEQSPQDYIAQLSETSGLPNVLITRNMKKIFTVFDEMEMILKGLTRGLDLSIIDSGTGEQQGIPVSYFATSETMGVVLPSNSPGVNSLWMPSVVLKVPVVLKPGREEPWTPYRIIQAFLAAGVPAEAFSFYPTDHEGSGAIMEACDRAVIFGDKGTVDRYAGNPGVEVHGPGWSKVILGEDQVDNYEKYLDLIVASVSDNGGRSCINASCLVVPRRGEEIAEKLAQRLSRLKPLAPDDPNAILSGFANPKMAEGIQASIEADLKTPGAVEVTEKYRGGERIVQREGSTYLLPTVIFCKGFDHPLSNKEFLFPYVSVVEMPQEEMLSKIGYSLVVTALTENPRFLDQIIASPHVERLNLGAIPTTRVEWSQPHEGNLFEFLYRRRAIQRA
ncbi:MAG: aldehyde dehydrogenase family protein [Chthonomonadaceae bacterium]|nr:aldehyde dehydrogenase family protein [Chthonomonadaceae bacterium]